MLQPQLLDILNEGTPITPSGDAAHKYSIVEGGQSQGRYMMKVWIECDGVCCRVGGDSTFYLHEHQDTRLCFMWY